MLLNIYRRKKMDITFTEKPEDENPDLKETVAEDNALKEFVVQYTGEKLDPEDGNITVEMIVEVFSTDFPELLMAIAEENFIRGYHQAMEDLEESEKILAETVETTADDE